MTDRVWTAERWDRGLWNRAHWNGQLGFNAITTAVTLRGAVASHHLTATTSSIVVSGIPVICRGGRGLRTQLGVIVLTGVTIGSSLRWHMSAEGATTPKRGQIEVAGIWANLVPFFSAGVLHFGIRVRAKRH